VGRLVRRFRPGLGIVLLAGLLLGPLALLVVVRLGSTNTLPGVTFDPVPVLATGTARQVTGEQAVRIIPAWDEGKAIYAPAWNGVVTAVYASTDATLHSGDRVAAVDNIDRIAYASATPFYRAISDGEIGPDVAALNQMLVTLGYLDALPSDPSLATFATSQAVRALAAKLGVTSSSTTFDPGWVVWLPSDPFPLASLNLSGGQQAPPPGSAIGAGQSTLTGATIAAAGQEPLTIDPSVRWVVVITAKNFAIDPAALAVDPAALPNLAPLLPQPSAASAGSSSPGGVPGASSGVAGTLERATPLDAVAIPSTAVMVGSNGGLCAWVPNGGGYKAVAILVDGASAGVTNAVSGLKAGEQLLANPGQALKDARCP